MFRVGCVLDYIRIIELSIRTRYLFVDTRLFIEIVKTFDNGFELYFIYRARNVLFWQNKKKKTKKGNAIFKNLYSY